MIWEYSVFSGSEPIGTVTMMQQGLYYKIDCRCALSGDVIYKVLIAGDDVNEDLGVCVPVGNAFGISTSIPVKRLAGKKFQFYAVPRHKPDVHDAVAVTEGSPFAYISKLENAFLLKKGNQMMIAFHDQVDSG